MKKMLNKRNQKHNFISRSGSDFLTSYGYGSGSTGQKVTVPTVPVSVPQRWYRYQKIRIRIRDEYKPDHISESCETIFLRKKILKILRCGSGMEKIRIRDPE